MDVRLDRRKGWAGVSIGLALAVLVLASFLRLYRLGHQSLWADEMSSLVTAVKPVPQLLYDISNEIHPPLYHLMLKVWISVFGTSEAGIRSLSVLFGIVLVGLTYLLGRRIFGGQVGLLAAFLAAIAPFQVYYSQEARMYMPLAAVGAAAVYSFVRFLEQENAVERGGGRRAAVWSWAAAYVLANGAGLWLHYSYPIVLVMESLLYGLWLALTWRRRAGPPRALRWAVMQFLVLAVYLPWLPIGYRQVSTWPAISAPHGLAFIVEEALRLFSLGQSVDPQRVGWTLALFAVLFVVGLLPYSMGYRQGDSRSPRFRVTAYVLIVCYALFPVLMMYGLSLLRPAYRPKFFLVGSPAFSIILARGILGPLWLCRTTTTAARLASGVWGVTCLVLVVMPILGSLNSYYYDPRYARDDYRGIAEYVQAVERAGDAVLLNAAGQKDVWNYYYRGDLPVYPLPRQRPPSAERTVQELEEIATKHSRLFAVFWATEESDPERLVEGWLDRHAYKALDSWYGNVRCVIYALPKAPAESDMAYPLDAVLGDEIRLRGYTLHNERLHAGEVLQLTLFWEALKAIDGRYRVFVHLLNADNEIVGQRDAEPGGGARLTDTWEPGEVIIDNYGVLVQPGTPPGTYRAVVGMYQIDGGRRLQVTGGGGSGADHVLLASVEVRSPEAGLPVEAYGIQHPVSGGEFDGLELVGYDLYRLGWEHDPQKALRPGDTVHLNLYWRVKAPLAAREVQLRLVERGGDVVSEYRLPLGNASSPPSSWGVGEIVRDQYNIPLGADLGAGTYLFEVSAPTGDGLARGPALRLEAFPVR